MATEDLIILRWDPPTTTGGTPILGYKIYMKETLEPDYDLSQPFYDGTEDPVKRLLYINRYKGAALIQDHTY